MESNLADVVAAGADLGVAVANVRPGGREDGAVLAGDAAAVDGD